MLAEDLAGRQLVDLHELRRGTRGEHEEEFVLPVAVEVAGATSLADALAVRERHGSGGPARPLHVQADVPPLKAKAGARAQEAVACKVALSRGGSARAPC